ncbi:hypothetical protein K435DRAFT_785428, partial [Dendrothele bispora CBS 962.96]
DIFHYTYNPISVLTVLFKLPSDVAFFEDPTMQDVFNEFVRRQEDWEAAYAAAHEKMNLLGYNKDDVIGCTKILDDVVSLEVILSLLLCQARGSHLDAPASGATGPL